MAASADAPEQASRCTPLMQCCQGYNASVQSWLSMRHCLNERCLPTLLGGLGKTDGATCEPGLFMLQQY